MRKRCGCWPNSRSRLAAAARANASRLLLETEQFEQAEASYRRDIELAPGHFGPHHQFVFGTGFELITIFVVYANHKAAWGGENFDRLRRKTDIHAADVPGR